MRESLLSFRSILRGLTISLIILLFLFLLSISDSRSKVVFCDVGQGDAAYIRIRNKIDLLIDAGPDRKVLGCLGKYMPFYDRTLETVILSHPQKDHYFGFLYLLDRYTILSFITNQIDNSSKSFQDLKIKLRERNVPIRFAKAGSELNLAEDSIRFYWPTYEFLKDMSVINSKGEREDVLFRSTGYDQNNFSLVFQFSEGDFKILFTGDISSKALNRLIDKTNLSTDILKVPHHGSKHGLSLGFLELADPRVSVISVGKNNSYGHPSKDVLDLLKAKKVQIRRTDLEGDIVFRL